MNRKMAYVVAVDSLHAIEGADAIEAARVGGWAVVTKKGESVLIAIRVQPCTGK